MTKVCKSIELDDQLLSEVMHRYVLDTEAEAVDFALRRLLPAKMSNEEALAMGGARQAGDLRPLPPREPSDER